MDVARCKTFSLPLSLSIFLTLSLSLSLVGDKAGPQRSLSNKSLVDNIFQPSANYTQFDPFGLPVPQQKKRAEEGEGAGKMSQTGKCNFRA